MTINYTTPEERLNRIVRLLIILIILIGLFTVYFYNRTVAIRQQLVFQEKSAADLEIKNAELKSSLFELTAVSRLTKVAVSLGLVKDASPEFLNLEQAAIETKAQTALRNN